MTGVNGVSYGPHGRTLIGEVIEASTTEILAQALELGGAPAFGTFVEVTCDDGITLYGVVAHVETGGIDPGARAIMRGHDDVRDDRIYVENPDLPLVLRTLFRAVIVGFASDGKLYQFLPPRPPRLHYSVFTCTSGSVERFVTSGLDYLGTLLMWSGFGLLVPAGMAICVASVFAQWHPPDAATGPEPFGVLMATAATAIVAFLLVPFIMMLKAPALRTVRTAGAIVCTLLPGLWWMWVVRMYHTPDGEPISLVERGPMLYAAGAVIIISGVGVLAFLDRKPSKA